MNIEMELMANEVARVIVKFMEIAEPNFISKVNRTSIEMLREIKAIIGDEKLTDFDVVEKIVLLFENNGIDCAGRHDF